MYDRLKMKKKVTDKTTECQEVFWKNIRFYTGGKKYVEEYD